MYGLYVHLCAWYVWLSPIGQPTCFVSGPHNSAVASGRGQAHVAPFFTYGSMLMEGMGSGTRAVVVQGFVQPFLRAWEVCATPGGAQSTHLTAAPHCSTMFS